MKIKSSQICPPIVLVHGQGGGIYLRVIAAWDDETFDMLYDWIARVPDTRFQIKTGLVYGKNGSVVVHEEVRS